MVCADMLHKGACEVADMTALAPEAYSATLHGWSRTGEVAVQPNVGVWSFLRGAFSKKTHQVRIGDFNSGRRDGLVRDGHIVGHVQLIRLLLVQEDTDMLA